MVKVVCGARSSVSEPPSSQTRLETSLGPIIENLSRGATAKRLSREGFAPKHSDNHGLGGDGGVVASYVRAFAHE